MNTPLQDLGLAIKRLQVRHHRAMNARLAPIGLTIVQWDALRHLDQNPDASLHDLAQLTFQTDQAFGTLATRMESNGLIERMPGPGRATRHQLTEKGRRLLAEGGTLAEQMLTASFSPLDAPQREVLSAMLAALLAATPE